MEPVIKKIIVIILILAAVAFVLIKKDILPSNLVPGLTKKAPFEADILAFVPAGVSSLTACNSGMQKMQDYWSTPAMKALGGLLVDRDRVYGLFSTFVPEKDKAVAQDVSRYIADISKAVLNSEAARTGFLIDEYVQYQAPGLQPLVPVTVAIATLKQEVDYKADFDALLKAGLEIKEEQSDGFTFYTMDYGKVFAQMMNIADPNVTAMPELKFYIASSGKKMGAGTSKEEIVRFFKGQKYEIKPAILETEGYKTALAKKPFDSSRDICQSYIDFAAMLSATLGSMPSTPGPNGEELPLNDIVKDFPVKGVLQTVGFDQSISFAQYWSVKEELIPADLKPWLDAVVTNTKLPGVAELPANTALATAVNGEVLKRLKATADKNPQFAEQVANIPYVDIAESVEAFTFSVMPPSTGVIWPEGIATVKLGKSKELYGLAKEQILAALNQSGMPIDKWLNKTISDVTVEYFSSPFGVGLFLAEVGDRIIASSSEPSMAAYLSASKKTSPLLAERLKVMGVPAERAVLFETFVSIPALLEMARAAQASLAMFMPEQIEIAKDYDIIANALGEYYLSIKWEPGYASFVMAQKPKS